MEDWQHPKCWWGWPDRVNLAQRFLRWYPKTESLSRFWAGPVLPFSSQPSWTCYATRSATRECKRRWWKKSTKAKSWRKTLLLWRRLRSSGSLSLVWSSCFCAKISNDEIITKSNIFLKTHLKTARDKLNCSVNTEAADDRHKKTKGEGAAARYRCYS